MPRVLRVSAAADEGMGRTAPIQAVENNEGADLVGIKAGIIAGPLASGSPAKQGDLRYVAAAPDGVDDGGDVPDRFIGAHQRRMRVRGIVHLFGPRGSAIAADVHDVD